MEVMDWKKKFEYEYPLYQLVGEFYNTALETLWRLPQTNLGCFSRSAFRNVQCLHFFQRLRFQARQGKGLAQISGESVSILFLVPCGISRDDFETLPWPLGTLKKGSAVTFSPKWELAEWGFRKRIIWFFPLHHRSAHSRKGPSPFSILHYK